MPTIFDKDISKHKHAPNRRKKHALQKWKKLELPRDDYLVFFFCYTELTSLPFLSLEGTKKLRDFTFCC